jgi:hypothetical protein
VVVAFLLAYSLTQMMEVMCSSEMSVDLCCAMRRYIPEDRLHRENHKSSALKLSMHNLAIFVTIISTDIGANSTLTSSCYDVQCMGIVISTE